MKKEPLSMKKIANYITYEVDENRKLTLTEAIILHMIERFTSDEQGLYKKPYRNIRQSRERI